MKVVVKISDMKRISAKCQRDGKTIGFVPTMGYLHDGHVSLIRAARRDTDVVVVSIFVNPAQFGPKEDLVKYPRDIKKDRKICEKEKVDFLFAPRVKEMYPDGYASFVDVPGRLSDTLCGRSRPGHFKGVATVLVKLFNIASPTISYFGEKDAQQCVIVKKLVEDLNINTAIKVMPIVREKDGLAMSSRNVYLSKEERPEALAISRSLAQARYMIKKGEKAGGKIKKIIKNILSRSKKIKVDYIEIVDGRSLKSISNVKSNTIIMVAAFIGKLRLIDNLWIKKP